MLREVWAVLTHPQMVSMMVTGFGFGWQLSKRLP